MTRDSNIAGYQPQGPPVDYRRLCPPRGGSAVQRPALTVRVIQERRDRKQREER